MGYEHTERCIRPWARYLDFGVHGAQALRQFPLISTSVFFNLYKMYFIFGTFDFAVFVHIYFASHAPLRLSLLIDSFQVGTMGRSLQGSKDFQGNWGSHYVSR